MALVVSGGVITSLDYWGFVSDGSTHVAELHWYEATGIGRKEFKIKHLL